MNVSYSGSLLLPPFTPTHSHLHPYPQPRHTPCHPQAFVGSHLGDQHILVIMRPQTAGLEDLAPSGTY